jgi:hypothetical protein
MILKIVEFRAFDKDCVEPFIDKENVEIEKHLDNMCFTYVITSIKEIDLRTVRLKKVDYEKTIENEIHK